MAERRAANASSLLAVVAPCIVLVAAACGRNEPGRKAEASTGSSQRVSAASATTMASAPSASASAASDASGGDRIYSKVRFLWIRPHPLSTQAWLGYLSLGDSVPVRGGAAAAARVADAVALTPGCVGWYAIEPSGYVCVGDEATLDANDPLVVELTKGAARRDAPLPYSYGESLGTPVYRSVPNVAEQQQQEPDLAAHLGKVALAKSAHDADELARLAPGLAGVPLEPTGAPGPPDVPLHPLGQTLTTRIWPGSTVAYTSAFDRAERSWLLAWDRGLVPRDRVRPYAGSDFHGVRLDAERSLPCAFFRAAPRPKYRRSAERQFEPTGEQWPRLASTQLTGQSASADGVRYLETRDSGAWCAERDAVVVQATRAMPPRVAAAREGRQTWVEVSVLEGWLIAYEGDRPVFATLISPGRGGIPFPGREPVSTASTPVGEFTVTGKFLTATMVSSSDANLVHAEVPYTQNFSGPHALHGAYWHDAWGEKKSGGCVNLSPRDSQWLFEWSEPTLPPGWHGVRWIPGAGGSTAVVIHR